MANNVDLDQIGHWSRDSSCLHEFEGGQNKIKIKVVICLSKLKIVLKGLERSNLYVCRKIRRQDSQ